MLFGLQQTNLISNIEIITDYPAKIAELYLQKKVDIALLPVAILNQLSNFHFTSNYCIGAVNEVASVSIFSQVPLQEIKTIILDYQSKTSVALTKILCKYYWKIDVDFINANENYINEIKGNIAAVIIGDRAFENKRKFLYDIDLALAWQQYTNLPFVFATWVSHQKFDDKFVNLFNDALQIGLNNIKDIAKDFAIEHYDLYTYYTQNISYHFDDEKKKGLNLFLKYLKEILP